VDENGLLTSVDLLIATGQNNLAMNRANIRIARQFVSGRAITEDALNRVFAPSIVSGVPHACRRHHAIATAGCRWPSYGRGREA
jgi:coenzyme F420-reducing hydrogenase alpha subunit